MTYDPYSQSLFTSDIPIENNIFKTNGAIGRWRYFLNNLIIGLVSGIVGMFIMLGLHSVGFTNSGVIVYYLIILAALPLSIINLVKRITDINGNRNDIVLWTVGATVLSFIPIVNIIVNLYILFKKGKITGAI